MMRHVVLVCMLAAVAMANKEDDCCSHDDRVAVLNYWESVWSPEFIHRRITIARAIFDRFFEHMPEAKSLFSRVHVDDMDSDEFVSHTVRVVNGLDLLINLAYDPDTLHQQLEHLGAQHARMDGVTSEHFEVFRQSMEEVLPQAIPCFDGEAFERCIAVDHHIIERMLSS